MPRELAAYRRKLAALRGLPRGLKTVLENLPASSQPMDVLRTGVSALGCLIPSRPGSRSRARATSPTGCSRVWVRCCATGITTAASGGASSSRPTTSRSAGTSCTCLHGRQPSAEWVRAMHTSLILYAEHEFNASTFTARVIAGTGSDLYSCDHRRDRRAARTQARRRQRGGVRNPEPLPDPGRGRGRHPPARGQQGSHHRLRSSGLHHFRSAQRRHQGGLARALAQRCRGRICLRSPSGSSRS